MNALVENKPVDQIALVPKKNVIEETGNKKFSFWNFIEIELTIEWTMKPTKNIYITFMISGNITKASPAIFISYEAEVGSSKVIDFVNSADKLKHSLLAEQSGKSDEKRSMILEKSGKIGCFISNKVAALKESNLFKKDSNKVLIKLFKFVLSRREISLIPIIKNPIPRIIKGM